MNKLLELLQKLLYKVCAYTVLVCPGVNTGLQEETASDEGTPLLLGFFSSFQFSWSLQPDFVMHRVDGVVIWFLGQTASHAARSLHI